MLPVEKIISVSSIYVFTTIVYCAAASAEPVVSRPKYWRAPPVIPAMPETLLFQWSSPEVTWNSDNRVVLPELNGVSSKAGLLLGFDLIASEMGRSVDGWALQGEGAGDAAMYHIALSNGDGLVITQRVKVSGASISHSSIGRWRFKTGGEVREGELLDPPFPEEMWAERNFEGLSGSLSLQFEKWGPWLEAGSRQVGKITAFLIESELQGGLVVGTSRRWETDLSVSHMAYVEQINDLAGARLMNSAAIRDGNRFWYNETECHHGSAPGLTWTWDEAGRPLNVYPSEPGRLPQLGATFHNGKLSTVRVYVAGKLVHEQPVDESQHREGTEPLSRGKTSDQGIED